MNNLEVKGINVHSPAYMPTAEGLSVPCVALEIVGRTIDGVDIATMFALAPEVVEALIPRLSQALAAVQSIPSASSNETH